MEPPKPKLRPRRLATHWTPPGSSPLDSESTTPWPSPDVNSSAPTPPTSPSLLAADSGYDDTDGWVLTPMVKIIKRALLHLLSEILQKFRVEVCNGCQTDHPSQIQHPCLFPLEEGFFSTHFRQLVKRLYTQRLIPAIQGLLRRHCITEADHRVGCVTQTLLHELKSERNLLETIEEMYEEVDDIQALHEVSASWKEPLLLETIEEMYEEVDDIQALHEVSASRKEPLQQETWDSPGEKPSQE